MAEDSEFNVRHLERLLTRRGHQVRLASNGREALNLVSELAFDLLLLDLHMPELDGFQVGERSGEPERAARVTPSRHRLDGERKEGRTTTTASWPAWTTTSEAGPGRGALREHRPLGHGPRKFPAALAR